MKCPECGSQRLDLTTSQVPTPGAPADGLLRTHDVSAVFVLGCQECSATVRTFTADQIIEAAKMAIAFTDAFTDWLSGRAL